MTDRYQVTGAQGTWQPHSCEQVLLNKQGIVERDEMDKAELMLLRQLYDLVLGEEFPQRRLNVADIKEWHRRWLGNLYDWAGQERSVNMGKGGFLFAAAAQIPRLLDEFDEKCLQRFTPCAEQDAEALSEVIAITHVELILIHPFREGNGRLSRLLADVMAVQAGYDPLDYSTWDAEKPAYYAAIQDGMSRNYARMKGLVSQVLIGQAISGQG
jgi:cell filamentation protein